MRNLRLILPILLVALFAIKASGQKTNTSLVMTDELWKRLTDRVLLTDAESNVHGDMLKLLGIGDGTKSLQCHQIGLERPDSYYRLLIPADEHKDVAILSFETDESARIYLVDKSRKLLGATIRDKDGTRRLDLKTAQETLSNVVMKIFARAASKLPQTK